MERQCSYPRSLTDVVLKKPRSKACREKLSESVVPKARVPMGKG